MDSPSLPAAFSDPDSALSCLNGKVRLAIMRKKVCGFRKEWNQPAIEASSKAASIYVLSVAPLDTGHMAEPGANQHRAELPPGKVSTTRVRRISRLRHSITFQRFFYAAPHELFQLPLDYVLISRAAALCGQGFVVGFQHRLFPFQPHINVLCRYRFKAGEDTQRHANAFQRTLQNLAYCVEVACELAIFVRFPFGLMV